MNWNKIKSIAELEEATKQSENEKIILFKHSTRCSVSSMALNRLERSWKDSETAGLKPYFLDLIAHRDISSEIANKFDVRHESPQVLVIENGECIYHNSHMGISYKELKQFAGSKVS
jgi:bacillithiol system protein YtxJ